MKKTEAMDTFRHLFPQAKEFMTSNRKKPARKNWDKKQKQTMIARFKTCPTCSESLVIETITREHMFPLILGGKEQEDNVTAMCDPCNDARNQVMGKILKSTKLAELRSHWPVNEEKIYEFISWGMLSIDHESYQVGTFPEHDDIFYSARGLKKPKPRKNWLSRIKSAAEAFLSAKEPEESTEKVECQCMNPTCDKVLRIPTQGDGDYRCTPSLGGCGEVFSATDLRTQNKPAEERHNDEEIGYQIAETEKFPLKEWLIEHRPQYDTIESVYVRLKLEIKKHEDLGKKRPVRVVLEQDFGISKNLPLAKIYARLNDLIEEETEVTIENQSTESTVESGTSENSDVLPFPNYTGLNTGYGIRFPRHPNQFVLVLDAYLEQVLKCTSFDDIVNHLKNRNITVRSRVSPTLSTIQRGLLEQSHDSKKPVNTAFDDVKSLNELPPLLTIIENTERFLLSCPFAESEEFMTGVKKYMEVASTIVKAETARALKKTLDENLPDNGEEVDLQTALGLVSDCKDDRYHRAKTWKDVKQLLGYRHSSKFQKIISTLWPDQFSIQLKDKKYYLSKSENTGH